MNERVGDGLPDVPLQNYTLRLKAAQRTAPQFRNDGKAAFAKLPGFGVSPNINSGVCGEQAESQGKRSLQVAICLCESRENYSANKQSE